MLCNENKLKTQIFAKTSSSKFLSLKDIKLFDDERLRGISGIAAIKNTDIYLLSDKDCLFQAKISNLLSKEHETRCIALESFYCKNINRNRDSEEIEFIHHDEFYVSYEQSHSLTLYHMNIDTYKTVNTTNIATNNQLQRNAGIEGFVYINGSIIAFEEKSVHEEYFNVVIINTANNLTTNLIYQPSCKECRITAATFLQKSNEILVVLVKFDFVNYTYTVLLESINAKYIFSDNHIITSTNLLEIAFDDAESKRCFTGNFESITTYEEHGKVNLLLFSDDNFGYYGEVPTLLHFVYDQSII